MKVIDEIYPFWSDLSDFEKQLIKNVVYTEKYNNIRGNRQSKKRGNTNGKEEY